MKSRRILGIKESESSIVWASSDAFLGGKALLSDTSNQSSLFSSSPNFFLPDNSTDKSHPPANSYGVPHHVSPEFNPLMLILLVVMVSAFYSLGFCSFLAHLCGCQCTGRSPRRVGWNGRMNGASRGGLDKSIIETFPVFNYSLVKVLKQGKEALECAVCLGEFEDDEALRLLPKCCHAFHPECIDMWLFSHATCPLCRSTVVPEANIAQQGMRVNVESQPQQRQSQTAEQIVIVVGVDGQGGGTNGMNPLNTELPRTSVGRSAATDSAINGIINGPRPVEKRSQILRRSHSTGHSLVRVGGNPERPSEFYMSTDDRYVLEFAEGLVESSATGLHRTSSYAAFCHSGLAGIESLEAFVNDRERLWRYPSSTEISEER